MQFQPHLATALVAVRNDLHPIKKVLQIKTKMSEKSSKIQKPQIFSEKG